MSIARAVFRTLRNLWAGLLHGHPAQCRTVWSAHGATYCWLCECSVTDDPVPGYVLVDRASGEIAAQHSTLVTTLPAATHSTCTRGYSAVGIDIRLESRLQAAETRGPSRMFLRRLLAQSSPTSRRGTLKSRQLSYSS